MIYACIENITEWLIRHKAISPSDRELYEYAIYSFLITILPLFIVIFIGGAIGKIWESIVIITPFMLLRKFSGGFHAKSVRTCFICSCVLLFLCIIVACNIPCNMVFKIITLGAATSLCIWSPIDSENRRLTPDEKKSYKKTTCIITLFFITIFVFLLVIKVDRFAVCIAMGLVLSAGLQLPCIIKELIFKLKDEVLS